MNPLPSTCSPPDLQPVQQGCFSSVILYLISARAVNQELEKRTRPNISILISFLVHKSPDKIFDIEPPIVLTLGQSSGGRYCPMGVRREYLYRALNAMPRIINDTRHCP